MHWSQFIPISPRKNVIQLQRKCKPPRGQGRGVPRGALDLGRCCDCRLNTKCALATGKLWNASFCSHCVLMAHRINPSDTQAVSSIRLPLLPWQQGKPRSPGKNEKQVVRLWNLKTLGILPRLGRHGDPLLHRDPLLHWSYWNRTRVTQQVKFSKHDHNVI